MNPRTRARLRFRSREKKNQNQNKTKSDMQNELYAKWLETARKRVMESRNRYQYLQNKRWLQYLNITFNVVAIIYVASVKESRQLKILGVFIQLSEKPKNRVAAASKVIESH
jgi:hypothetical protein